jgi:tetratricopeptide (TPR) repeat protein
MYRFDEGRRLPAAIVSAAVFAAPFLAAAQASTSEFSPARPTLGTTAAPVPQPTPEALGDSLMAHRRYQAAIEAYKQSSEMTADVWNKMGISYQMMFNLQDATRCYQESLKLEPKNVNVLNNLGTVYDSLKQYKMSVRMYHKALKLDPKSALVLKNLGTDLLAQHQYKKGWEVYKDALAIDPQIFDHNPGPRVENPASVQERGAMNYYMAKGCVRAGKNDRAIEYLRMALNEGFTNPKKLASDQEFAGLHGVPAFEQLMAEQKSQ